MKTKIILETLAVVALTAGQAIAAPLPLQHSTISAAYKGSADGMLGLDQLFAPVPGSNVTAIDPGGANGVEFLSADFLFGIDFAEDGVMTVYNNGPVAAGAYSMRFDFGASLAAPLARFTLIDSSAVGGIPVLSLIDGHTIGLDLSALDWGAGFTSFSARLDAAPSPVPEPATVTLMLAGLASIVFARRRVSQA
ncbi:PEP-CTERM sorting domain-containing protein [Massilia antarctica]|uniref:PEP-CTERM sorting domain-containing protein n=1 Tax=Massilia antarctica TaxID=2765360 RepID=A0AA48WAX3_9BURK|nr:PEP-CTERM sorting domain-containing protein [Massilia antarctica]QPI47920.1 PEP-CTERM sorting domain-containing protein [Massilia antarctica]